MDDLSDIKYFASIYQKMMDEANSNDYIVNRVQMKKFLKTIQFLQFMVERWGNGKVSSEVFKPEREHGEAIVKCISFPVNENEMEQFREILSYCSGFDVVPVRGNMVEMSFIIPDVYVKKPNKV